MLRIWTMLLLVPWASAQAGEVHKCVGKGGAVSYQSEPCASDQRTAKTVSYVPEARPTPAQRAAQRERQRQAYAESAYLSNLAGTSRNGGRTRGASGARIQAAGSGAACDAAKLHRQAVLDQAGLRRTYDLLSKLDEAVREACG